MPEFQWFVNDMSNFFAKLNYSSNMSTRKDISSIFCAFHNIMARDTIHFYLSINNEQNNKFSQDL